MDQSLVPTDISKHLSKEFLSNFYSENVNRIYKFFLYKVGIKHVAEDLTSETFMMFVEHFKKNSNTINNLQGFLFGIANNVFKKYLQDKYKKEFLISSFFDDEINFVEHFVEEDLQSKSYEEILIKFLPRIPKKQRQILSMRFLDKLSLSEIAKLLNKNMNYVKTTQKRAFTSIRRAIELDRGTLNDY